MPNSTNKAIYATESEHIGMIASHIEEIIRLLGEDPTRQGLVKTPERAAKALWHLTSGYRKNPEDTIGGAMFNNEGSEIVVVKDIEFYSLCEHHVLPFYGKISVGYVPGEKIVGLSKIARMVEVFARRLQVQERLTTQIADFLLAELKAKGVIVRCEGEHMCMKMRGVEKQHSSTATIHYNGVFCTDPALRKEFLGCM